MQFHEYKAELSRFFHKMDEERCFESDAQRDYIRDLIEGAVNEETLQEARSELMLAIKHEIKDFEAATPILENPMSEIEFDKLRKEAEEYEARHGANGTLYLYSRFEGNIDFDAKLEGCVKDVVLTETKEAKTTTVETFRISVMTLIDLIKEHGKRE